jgi:DNA (cytosine-5)-methyltransferase 1
MPAVKNSLGKMRDENQKKKPTLGSLFAGIGGADLGFERAGWETAWQVEWNDIKRACLAHRFPAADRRGDIREAGAHNLSKVDCIFAGFPCKDISQGGASSRFGRPGLKGARSGLFWEALRVIEELWPTWVVLENVEALLFVNGGKDFETIIRELAHRGYVGCWRVLDAAGFGVPSRRRRLFPLAGHHRTPPFELLSDASPVEGLPSAFASLESARQAHSFAGYTLLAQNTRSRITLGGQLLITHQDRWSAMDERERMSRSAGVPLGLDDANHIEAHAAGDAVVPQVAEWIGRKLYEQMIRS